MNQLDGTNESYIFDASVEITEGRLSLYFEDTIHGDDLLIYINDLGVAVVFETFLPEGLDPETAPFDAYEGREVPFNMPGGLIAYIQRRHEALAAFYAEQDVKKKGD